MSRPISMTIVIIVALYMLEMYKYWLQMSENVQRSFKVIYTVSQKKRHPFSICDNLVRRHPILPIFGRNTRQYWQIWMIPD